MDNNWLFEYTLRKPIQNHSTDGSIKIIKKIYGSRWSTGQLLSTNIIGQMKQIKFITQTQSLHSDLIKQFCNSANQSENFSIENLLRELILATEQRSSILIAETENAIKDSIVSLLASSYTNYIPFYSEHGDQIDYNRFNDLDFEDGAAIFDCIKKKLLDKLPC